MKITYDTICQRWRGPRGRFVAASAVLAVGLMALAVNLAAPVRKSWAADAPFRPTAAEQRIHHNARLFGWV